MMKRMKTALALILAAAAILILPACGSGERSASDREGAKKLYDEFFDGTFRNANQVVTVSGADGEIYTENILGTSGYAVYGSGAETWSFVKDGEFYYAIADGDTKTVLTGEDTYYFGYYAYRNYLSVFELLPPQGVEFSCTVKDSTLRLEARHGEEGQLSITATQKDGLVRELTYRQTDEGESLTVTMAFSYGNASLTLPDLSDFQKDTSGS